ncbi:MAG TPA: nuclear transport factor 2 family protein [Chitinophagaceae bacterium]|jgi:hypothetical protein|nr:nuclear transport factor 2 family protein [Chitinophagaceae bacterium]
MEESIVEAVIIRIFNGTDSRQWEMVRNNFADEVLVDYTSVNGRPASVIKADELIESWRAFLPKFKFTFHRQSNFQFEFSEKGCNVFCKGDALHHLPGAEGGDLWTVYGTYHFELTKRTGQWKVTVMKFDLLYQQGNTRLPAIAAT